MSSAAQAVDSPFKGMIVKNTFIDVAASDDEEVVHCRRGTTMPAMPREPLAAEEQPNPEPSPMGVTEKAAEAEQPLVEPSPESYPTLISAMQRKSTAELADRKVIVKNTFIDTQEPDASPSPGHGRRVTCPVILPSMDKDGEPLTAFGMKASGEDASDDEPSAVFSGQTGVSNGSEAWCADPAASSDDDDDAPRTRAQRWGCVQTEDLRDQLAAAEAKLQSPDGRAPAFAGQHRVSFPEEAAGASATDSDCETPRGPRRGGAWDTQDLRDALLQGSMPELEANGGNKPGAPCRVPVSLFAAAVGNSPGQAPLMPPSPSAPFSPSQAQPSPAHGSPQLGVPLSLSSFVPASAACVAGPAPLSPPSPAAPTSPLGAQAAAGAGPASPGAAAAAQLGPGGWPMPGAYGFPYGAQMPWAPQWPWHGMPTPEMPAGGSEAPPSSPPQREGPAGAAPRGRNERRQAGRQAQGNAQPPAADEAAPRQESGAAHAAPAATTRNGRRLRLWAHIYLHMQVQGFDLVPRLIGRRGCNMRKIAEATNSKIRIRGRGSGHLEIDGKEEAPTPLMVAVTTDKFDEVGFRAAVDLILKDLQATEQRYRSYCKRHDIKHEGPCYSIGLLPEDARQCLGALIDGVPTASTSKAS